MNRQLLALCLVFAIISIATATRTHCNRPNEFWNECASACELTCCKPIPGPCTDQCVARCDCEKGYVRNKKNGQCVLPSEC